MGITSSDDFPLLVGVRESSDPENGGEGGWERYGGGLDSEGTLDDKISPFLFRGGNPYCSGSSSSLPASSAFRLGVIGFEDPDFSSSAVKLRLSSRTKFCNELALRKSFCRCTTPLILTAGLRIQNLLLVHLRKRELHCYCHPWRPSTPQSRELSISAIISDGKNECNQAKSGDDSTSSNKSGSTLGKEKGQTCRMCYRL